MMCHYYIIAGDSEGQMYGRFVLMKLLTKEREISPLGEKKFFIS